MKAISVANTMAKPLNWATFDPVPRAKKWCCGLLDFNTVNISSMGFPEIGLLLCPMVLEVLAPLFGDFLVCTHKVNSPCNRRTHES